MWRKKYFSITLFLGSLFFFPSCGNFQPVQITGVDSLHVSQLNAQGVSAEIGVRIKNPNSTSFTLYSSDVDVKLNSILLGKAHLAEKVTIPGNAEKTQIFKVKTDFAKISIADVLSMVSNLSNGNDSVSLKGEMKAGNLFYKKIFPINVVKPLNGNISFKKH